MEGRQTPGSDGTESAPWPVMVLAYNEEKHVAACLDSIFAAEPGRALEVYVMANGCTDRTEEIVRNYGHPAVRLVSIVLGDKCNAWNLFVHETLPAFCPGRPVYFFMNADVTAVKGSFSAMAVTLQQDLHAHAASAFPFSGRSAVRYRVQILEEHGLMGNLYALRGEFLERVRALSVRLPLNFEGDDGLIGALAKFDLAPERNGPDHRRIRPCETAGFEFESLSLLRLADWKEYWGKSVRYGRRHYEFEILKPRLRAGGLGALPADIADLYAEAVSLPLRWDGLHTLPNLVALRQVRSIAKRRSDR